jgi:hypothetical protein
LRQEIGEHHAQARLHILQGGVLHLRPASHPKVRGFVDQPYKEGKQRANNRINVHVQVVRADLLSDVFRAIPCRLGAMLGRHVASVKDTVGEFTRIGGEIMAILVRRGDATGVAEDLWIACFDFLHHHLAHHPDLRGHRGAIGTTREG